MWDQAAYSDNTNSCILESLVVEIWLSKPQNMSVHRWFRFPEMCTAWSEEECSRRSKQLQCQPSLLLVPWEKQITIWLPF